MLLLAEEGIVSLKEAVFTDGTKIESAANRYTFVWGKSIKTSKDRIKAQLDDLWKYAQGVAAEELKDPSPAEFEQVNATGKLPGLSDGTADGIHRRWTADNLIRLYTAYQPVSSQELPGMPDARGVSFR